ncbi:MAG TPA: hypothetical protein VL096_15390 [Pirellulaceae bacterium]|nr:hypothetical protein [Pirellulaceae bacterium]
MLKRISRRPWLMLTAGLTMGLLVGVGLMVGALVGAGYVSQSRTPEIPLHAVATHGTDTMAICTTPMGDGVEALCTLDFLTGELSVFSLNNKTAAFTLGGKYNVMTDLKIAKGKKVNFLLVSGSANFVRGGGSLTPASSAIYVCDANTGAFVSYGLAYSSTAYATATPAEIAIRRLDVGMARTLNLGE